MGQSLDRHEVVHLHGHLCYTWDTTLLPTWNLKHKENNEQNFVSLPRPLSVSLPPFLPLAPSLKNQYK